MASAGLWHPQVDIGFSKETKKIISDGQYRPTPNDEVLDPTQSISGVWPEPPPHGHLHIYVGLPSEARDAADAGISDSCQLFFSFVFGQLFMFLLVQTHLTL